LLLVANTNSLPYRYLFSLFGHHTSSISNVKQLIPDITLEPKTVMTTVAKMASLKTDATVSIPVGPPGNNYTVIEGAFAKLLMHYSDLAKKELSKAGIKQLSVGNGEKAYLVWMYRYMLAGERDPPGQDKFESFSVM
jgi:uncharacterized membrane protein